MPDEPTNPGDVVVVGQRRTAPSDPFPGLPAYVEPGGEFDEREPIGEQPDPCANPVTRREWDRDAAAASARKKIEAAALLAGETGLTHRERACWLLRQPDGSIIASSPIEGDVFQPGVTPTTFMDPYAVGDMSQIVGIVHNHDIGFHAPSSATGNYGGDAAALATLQNIMSTYPSNDGWEARLYIVAQTTTSPPYNMINVYGPDTIGQGLGPEVNPDADEQACPVD
ncbi:hypothetical protein BH10PSE1_BH10PSE1_12130 [soil metagenome]